MEKENPKTFFCFSFRATLSFTFINALVYVNIDWGIHKRKLKNALNEKQKKTTWVFFFYKYGKFWSVSPDKKVDLKTLFSEEWYGTYVYFYLPHFLLDLLRISL